MYCRSLDALSSSLVRILRKESSLQLLGEQVDVLLSLGHLDLHGLHASAESSIFIFDYVVLDFKVPVIVFNLLTLYLFELLGLVGLLSGDRDVTCRHWSLFGGLASNIAA